MLGVNEFKGMELETLHVYHSFYVLLIFDF